MNRKQEQIDTAKTLVAAERALIAADPEYCSWSPALQSRFAHLTPLSQGPLVDVLNGHVYLLLSCFWQDTWPFSHMNAKDGGH